MPLQSKSNLEGNHNSMTNKALIAKRPQYRRPHSQCQPVL